jgi:hypothetical protein
MKDGTARSDFQTKKHQEREFPYRKAQEMARILQDEFIPQDSLQIL